MLLVTVGHPVHAQPDGNDEHSPLLLVHYMPWYQARPFAPAWGWHWTMNVFNPDTFDAEGRREIASHYYPLVGPYDSRDPDVLEYHTLLMKVSGIDGVIVDWYGTSDLFDYPMLHEGTQQLFEAVRRAGLRFAIMYEDQTVGHLIDAGRLSSAEAIAHGQEQMRYVRDAWMSQPEYVTLEGRPVLLTFGPLYFRTSTDWAQILEGFEIDPLLFTLDNRLVPAAEGAFPWPPMWASVNGTLSLQRVHQYLNAFYSTAEAWPYFIAGAFPGFHDVYAEAGVGASYGFLDANEGQTFSETLQRALEAEAPVVQIVTWNDFGEGTNIEPTEEYGYRYLDQVQQTADSLRELPFDAADLDLPLQLYISRKQYQQDASVGAQLDEAASAIVDGDADRARDLLQTFTETESDLPDASRAVLEVYPTPASDVVTVVVNLPAPEPVRLEVFDIMGRSVAVLADGAVVAGRGAFVWSASHVPAGVYFVRLRTNASAVTVRTPVVH